MMACRRLRRRRRSRPSSGTYRRCDRRNNRSRSRLSASDRRCGTTHRRARTRRAGSCARYPKRWYSPRSRCRSATRREFCRWPRPPRHSVAQRSAASIRCRRASVHAFDASSNLTSASGKRCLRGTAARGRWRRLCLRHYRAKHCPRSPHRIPGSLECRKRGWSVSHMSARNSLPAGGQFAADAARSRGAAAR